MQGAVDALGIASITTFAVLGVTALAQWRRGAGRPAGWAAATFLMLAAVTTISRAGEIATGSASAWAEKPLLAGIALFPYLLFRFQASFRDQSRGLEALVAALTFGTIAWGLALGPLPEAGAPRGAVLQSYAIALAVQWIVILSVVIAQLWRAGRGQPSVARLRARLLALGTLGLTLAVVVSAAGSSAQAYPANLLIQVISLGSAILFFLGLTPPRSLRTAWRRPQREELRKGIGELILATRPEEVAAHLAPFAASIVGASAAAMHDRSGRVLGAHGQNASSSGADPTAHRIDLRHATLTVWTSPYTPFFGADELEELRSLGNLADLALERCLATAREREFVSNAAHELRTPLTTVYGMAVTLEEHHDEMNEEQRRTSVAALRRQSEHARVLINELLDLARIESGMAEVELTPLRLADAVAAALATAPAPEGSRTSVDVDGTLMAMANEDALERILVNLLTNAYTHGGPTVRVESRVERESVSLVVVDDGPGIDPERTVRLFEPFARGGDAGAPGAGLGLSISRRLAEAQGGSLSYAPGQDGGARFTLQLAGAG